MSIKILPKFAKDLAAKLSLSHFPRDTSPVNTSTPLASQLERPVEVSSVAVDPANLFTRQELQVLLAPPALEFKKTLHSNFGGKVRIKNCLDDLFREVLANVGDIFTKEKQQEVDLFMEGKSTSSVREIGHEPELQLHSFPSEHQLVLNIIKGNKLISTEELDLSSRVLNIYKFNEKSKRYLTQQMYYNRLSDGKSQQIQILYDPLTGKKTYFSIDGMQYKLDKHGNATLCDGLTTVLFQPSQLLQKVPNLFELIKNNTVQASPNVSFQQRITTSLVNSFQEWGSKVFRNPITWVGLGISSIALGIRSIGLPPGASFATNAALQPSSLHQEHLVPIIENQTLPIAPSIASPVANLANHQTVIFTGEQLAKDCPLKAKSEVQMGNSPTLYTVPAAEGNCSILGTGLTFRAESPELKVPYSSQDYNPYLRQVTFFNERGNQSYLIEMGGKRFEINPGGHVTIPLPSKTTIYDLKGRITQPQPAAPL